MNSDSMASWTCSLKSCKKGMVSEDTGRYEVSTVLPPRKLSLLRSKFKVNWDMSGGAIFHKGCWHSLYRAAQCRIKKKSPIPTMVQTEKVMIKQAATTAERHDSISTILTEAKHIAEMLKSAQHCVAFTGAGISTSAGIGDFRGKTGKWTELALHDVDIEGVASEDARREESRRAAMKRRRSESFSGGTVEKKRRFSEASNASIIAGDIDDNEEEDGVPYDKLRPTYTHEALYKLMELGYLKFIISQNGDGLHGLSGVPLEKMAELHGNVFLEKCENCKMLYQRRFYVLDDCANLYFDEIDRSSETDIVKPLHAEQCQLCGLSHRTGRFCEKEDCKGYLVDSIINFRDLLDPDILGRARDNAKKSDLMLCMGTTLLVTPANDLVWMGTEPLHLMICNRQKTHMDREAAARDRATRKPLGSRVFADCDDLMREVMKHLLSAEELQCWESERPERMKVYDSQRD